VRTISIVNQKGGCGKTTTAINLAAVAARQGKRVLLVDLDPQSHCASGLGVPEVRIERQVGDLLIMRSPTQSDISESMWHVSANFDLLPSTMSLAGIEAPSSPLSRMPDRDRRLEYLLDEAASGLYDLCIVDCPPSIGLLTFNALRAATNIVIPVETGYFALQGAEKQVETIATVSRRLQRMMPFALLPTLYDDRVRLSREILEQLRKKFDTALIPKPIRYCVRLREAASFGQPVTEYAPGADSAIDYESLYTWIINNLPEVLPASCYMAPSVSSGVAGIGNQTPFNTQPSQAASASMGITPFPPQPFSDHDVASTQSPQRDNVAYVESNAASVVEAITNSQRSAMSSKPNRVSSDETSQPTPPEIGVRSSSVANTIDSHTHGKLESHNTREALSNTPGARAAELAKRARELSRRHEQFQQKLVDDPNLPDYSDPVTTQNTCSTGDAASATAVRQGVANLYGHRRTPQGVLFIYHALSPNQRISIVGDFNDWNPERHKLQYNIDLQVFETCIPLAEGRYRYRLVIDDRWVEDPHNKEKVINDLGEQFNILRVD